MVKTFLNLNKIKKKFTKLTQIKGKIFKYICHVIDHFSGYNIIWAHERRDAKDVVEGLKTLVFSYFGLPKIFHSDNGLEFKIKIWYGHFDFECCLLVFLF